MYKFAYRLLLLLSLALLCGCSVSVDYTGQKFSATPEHSEVKFLRSRQELNLDDYAIIGRMTVTAYDAGSDHYTFQKALLEKTREFGGDAVCQVEAKTITHGAYATNAEEFGAPDMAKAVPPAIDPAQRGNPAPLKGDSIYVKRKQVKALVLKKRADVKKFLE